MTVSAYWLKKAPDRYLGLHFKVSLLPHMSQAQLEDIVERTAISRHLAELAHLYEATSPVLANLYALVAPLSPESLPESASGRDFSVDGFKL